MKTIIFIALLLLSPWTWILSKNITSIQNQDNFILLKPSGHVFITEINNLQTQAANNQIAIPGRIIINKATWYIKKATDRYLQSFDPQFLFMVGDISPNKSVREAGPLLLSFLPLISLGIKSLIRINKYYPVLLLALSPFPAAINGNEYDLLSRIPLLVMLTYCATLGFAELYPKYKKTSMVLCLISLIEFSRFFHFLYAHPLNV